MQLCVVHECMKLPLLCGACFQGFCKCLKARTSPNGLIRGFKTFDSLSHALRQ